MRNAISLCLLGLVGLLPLSANAQETFQFPLSSDSYDYDLGYPYMGYAGDIVEGYRSTPDIPSANYLYLDTYIDVSNLWYCQAAVLFYYDDIYLGYTILDPGYAAYHITASFLFPAEQLTDTTNHRFAIELANNTFDDCLDWIEIDDEISEWTLDLIGADVDNDGHYAQVYYGDDCNDSDSTVFPGNSEVCDGKDNNCVGGIDEGVKQTFYPDGDSDGYGSAASPIQACSAPSGYVSNSGDCDDGDSSAYPGGNESCDGIDNDCDGDIDEGTLSTYYEDIDGDTYGTSATIEACSKPLGYATRPGDCNDGDDDINPGASESCNGVDDNCAGGIDEGVTTTYYTDNDDDGYGVAPTAQACNVPSGYSPTSGDCNDGDESIYPGAAEVCDGVDNNCDGTSDEGVKTTYYADDDEDGFGDLDSTATACAPPNGFVDIFGDCDDGRADVNPEAPEVCDGADNDCDEGVDEGALTTFYGDGDGDGVGVAGETTQSCSRPSGYSPTFGDCDDGDDEVYPDAPELCDEKDNDCDEIVDEGVLSVVFEDSDGDGFGNDNVTQDACQPPDGYVGRGGDCDDSQASINPDGDEACNSEDDDCDGMVDEGVTTTYYGDADGDGVGVASAPVEACDLPEGSSAMLGDCDDSDPSTYPDAPEACDGADNDCDGEADEGVTTTFYLDQDGDAYGQGDQTTQACARPQGYAALGGDCDDTSDLTFPGADELCDGADNNCDGGIDEEVQTLFYGDNDGDGSGVEGVTTLACEEPSGYASAAGDCDDDDPGAYPGAQESCDGIDNDCDDDIDEGQLNTYYEDGDGDGYGLADAPIEACARPEGAADVPGDCDDGDAEVRPGASEACNGVDDDCNGAIDNGVTSPFWRDGDGDGFGDPSNQSQACEAPSGYVDNDEDCRDNDATAYPGADEACDTVDDDCDGLVDEGVKTTFYADADLDTFGDGDATFAACARPNGYSDSAGDCDDGDASVNPLAEEACDEIDQDCDESIDEGVLIPVFLDEDGDGFGDPSAESLACAPGDDQVDNDEDCDDADPLTYPGGVEICGDDIDQDCNGYAPTCDESDQDGDGVSPGEGDCDDDDAEVYPGAEEICGDGIDNDCAGGADNLDWDQDGYIAQACGGPDCDDLSAAVSPEAEEICGDGIDNDCSGAQDDRDDDLDGYAPLACGGEDCDDDDPRLAPGLEELCDGLDNDCSGVIDDRDIDEDGESAQACQGPDCDDLDPEVGTFAEEIEDGIDNDCDGLTDEGTDRFDDDGDGYTEGGGDCDDGDAAINPGSAELPEDGIDNDCDGEIDEEEPTPTVTTTPDVTPTATGEEPTPTPGITPSEGETGTIDITPTFDSTPSEGETGTIDITPTLDETETETETETEAETPSPSPSQGLSPSPSESPSPTIGDGTSWDDTPTVGVMTPTAPGGGEGCACDGSEGEGEIPGAALMWLMLGFIALRSPGAWRSGSK